MYKVSDQRFEELVEIAVSSLKKKHSDHLENIAILYAELPTQSQRIKMNLGPHQTLLGLYEGVPLPQRQGNTKTLPDKITLFKIPLELRSNDEKGLLENINHTLWHEIAHYFGLDHDQIDRLDHSS